MASQALYRKWRPQTFDEVIGQGHVTRTLRNALRGGKVAHAYLFAGPRGTGKTSMARILAKAVNCLSEGDDKPCDKCAICRSISEGRCMDLIEIDAASNRGIDEIRDLRQKVHFAPSEAKYKVYVIDEAHMLTNEAFNALLKTLEEPPPHVIFVLATTAPHKIPPTVLSRCQRFDFHRIPLEDLKRKLTRICQQEGIAIEPAALELISRSATGSFRDAESLLDQLVSYGGGEISLAQVQAMLGTVSTQAVGELVGHIIAKDTKSGLHLINRVIDDGNDPRQFDQELMEYLRGLLLIKTGGSSLLNVTAEAMAEMAEQAKSFSLEGLVRAIRLFNRAGLDLKTGLQPQLPLELAFIEATLPQVPETITNSGPSRPVAMSAPSTETTSPSHEDYDERSSIASAEAREAIRRERSSKVSPPPKPASRDESARPEQSTALKRIRDEWPQVLARIKPRNRSIEALLKACQPIDVMGETVALGFYYSFHKERIEESGSKALVEEALSEVMGSPCRIRCVLSPRVKGTITTSKQPRTQVPPESVLTNDLAVSRQPSVETRSETIRYRQDEKRTEDRFQAIAEDPLVKAAVERYGAKIVDVKHPDGVEGE